MRCDQIETRLDAYLDGELSAAEAAALEPHLEACSACRRELASLRELRRVCSDRLRVTPPPGLQERILAAATAAAAGDRSRPRRWRRARWPLALAAAASLAVAVLLPRLREREAETAPAAAFTTPARVVVPRYGERAGHGTPVKFGGIDLGRTPQRRS